MSRRLRGTLGAAVIGLAWGCASQGGAPEGSPPQAASVNVLADADRAAGWQLLFDGRTTTGWRGYMMDTMPDGWQVVDGALTRVARAGDIVTVGEYGDFELSLEWMISERGNSGVFYRAVEGLEHIYYGAPEMQVLDDAGHPDGRNEVTSAGSNFGLYPAPRGVVRPAGQWNTARVVARGAHVEHWLNGQKVVEYEQGSVEWQARVQASKFRQWPEYGKAMKGRIGLQEHGSRVAFRNIRIRVLAAPR
jgi:hypothetical protein